jgi:hypothetical protein
VLFHSEKIIEKKRLGNSQTLKKSTVSIYGGKSFIGLPTASATAADI